MITENEEIRCQECGVLLCKKSGDGVIHIRRKGMIAFVVGPVIMTCWRCGTRVSIHSPKESIDA